MAGILRSVGAQIYISILMLVGYYVIGSPIGISLLLTTELKDYGFFVGISTGTFLVVFFQAVYAMRIDWNSEAKKVSNSFLFFFSNLFKFYLASNFNVDKYLYRLANFLNHAKRE